MVRLQLVQLLLRRRLVLARLAGDVGGAVGLQAVGGDGGERLGEMRWWAVTGMSVGRYGRVESWMLLRRYGV